MNSIERLIDTLKKERDDLAGSGYTVSVFVHHDCENAYVGFGDPAKILEGLLYSLTQVKAACLGQGISEEEYKSIYNAALVAAMLQLAADNKEKKENADT